MTSELAGPLQRSAMNILPTADWCQAGRTGMFVATLLTASQTLFGRGVEHPFPGADETTPARSHYFDWINSQYEGSTEAHTLTNLDFFKWMHDEFGMGLDVYSLDVGNIDDGPYTAGVGRLIPNHYGTMESREYRRQFPRGFTPLVEKAASFDCRLGIWLGPDGFGDTPEQEQARHEMLVSLCRDHDFVLLKIDSVAGGLRPDKQDALIRALEECRTHCPDLIVLNERVDFGRVQPYVTTNLWEGVETYIDVFMWNRTTAPHHRAGALERELTPGMSRLMEDHGVCLSSCLDYWDDELVLQAFNRCLVVSPQIYGNPWFLRDDEFPKLARIFNLHRKYRQALVSAIALPEDQYGPYAVARGDGNIRFLTLRNLSWRPVKYGISLDESIGLAPMAGRVKLRRLHPTERLFGSYRHGSTVQVEVLPFRTCLLVASIDTLDEVGVHGCDYQVVRDVPGKPVIVDLLGMPGARRDISLAPGGRRFLRAELDGQPCDHLVRGRSDIIDFPGDLMSQPWHRKIGDLESCAVPGDAEALFETTCFAADSNALEARCIDRSGPTSIPQVQAARDAFFAQPMFVNRGIWDRNLFDGDINTHFVARLKDRTLRVDFGEATNMDTIVLRMRSRESHNLAPEMHRFAADATAEVSTDLRTWTPLAPAWGGVGTIAELTVPDDEPVRYLRITGPPRRIAEIEAFRDGLPLDRAGWGASNLLGSYSSTPAVAAWRLTIRPDQIPQLHRNALLAVALDGPHGSEGAYAALRVGDQLIGAPDRAVSYPSNTWEYFNVDLDSNYTYFFPLDQALAGKTIEVIVLIMEGGENAITPSAWLTAYPIPHEKRRLILYEDE